MTGFGCSFPKDFFPFFFAVEFFPPPMEGVVFGTMEEVAIEVEGVATTVVAAVVVEDVDGCDNAIGPGGSGVGAWLEGSINVGVQIMLRALKR